jgi:hypothetical protein
MTRICWWFVDMLSRMLESGEREAVRGDLAESGESGPRALRDLVGLVVRRQVELWKDWRHWLALVGLAGLAGGLLSEVVFRLNLGIGDQLRTYTYWKQGVQYANGLTVGQNIAYLLCLSSALLLWSWTTGFLLGSVSRRVIWLMGPLLYLVVNDSFITRLILSGALKSRNGRPSLTIVFQVFPLGIGMILFSLAAIRGIYQGLHLRMLRCGQTFLLAGVIAVVTALLNWTGGWIVAAQASWSGGAWHGNPWGANLLPLALVSWPAGYMVMTAAWRQWHRGISPV